jgi:dipeptidyl aminopeptidase/acylaminoacyl peptidase
MTAHHFLYRTSILIILLSLLLMGCDANPSPSFATVTATQVIGPDDAAMSMAWLDEWIVVVGAPAAEAGFVTILWRFRPDGTDLAPLAIPIRPHSACEPDSPYSFGSPQRLPDGRLGYMMRCRNANGPGLKAFLMAADLATDTYVHLRSEPLPHQRGNYSWNPTMTRGIASTGTRGLEEQLYWFTPTSTAPYATGFPQAAQAEWSPDGARIAFVAAPNQARGLAGLDAITNLYLAQADGSQITPLVQRFRYPGGLAWSPDGRWLVLSAQFGETAGLWLIDARSGARQQLTTERYTAPAWSPDGTSLVAFVRLDPEALISNYRVIRLDLTWHTDNPE